jgi:hypothetical protein
MENQPTQDQLQEMWDEEATKLDAGDNTPAVELDAVAPVEPPQDTSDPQTEMPEDFGGANQAAAVPEDPFAGLPDAVKQKLAQIDQLAQSNAQLLQHVRSAEGRVAAMQRELQVAKVAQQSIAPQDAPTQTQINSASKTPEKWEQLRADFPEWAGAMEEYVAAKLGSVQPQGPSLDPRAVAEFTFQQVTQAKAEMARLLEEARVEGKYEDWKQQVNTTEFAQWFSAQPSEIQALASSSAARDAIRMLDLFHQSKTRTATEIKQERGARLAAAATTRPGQTPPPKTLDDMSPEELWNYEARKRDKERAKLGY